MMRSVAVVPAAPALIPELMAGAAPEVDPVREAATRAMAAVARSLLGPAGLPPLGRLVIAGLAADGVEGGSRSYDLAGAVTDTSFGTALALPALPGAAPATNIAAPEGDPDVAMPTPLLIARRLAADVAREHPETDPLWRDALWITLTPEAVDDYARSLVVEDAPIGLVLIADGAACHGPKAPRAEDPRANAYDDAVCRALTSADPGDFAVLDRQLGHDLTAEGADLWPLLAAAAADTQGHGWRPELLWRGTPYGVGWFVATWQR